MGSVIERPYLALSHIHAQAGALNRPVLNYLGCSTPRLVLLSLNPLKTSTKQNAIKVAILKRVLDRD